MKKALVTCSILVYGLALGQSGEQYHAQQEQIKLALKSAAECVDRGDWSRAKAILRDANETFPGNTGITYRLGLLEIRDREYSSALRTFSSTRYDRGWDRRRYLYVGYLYLKTDQVSESRKMWTGDLMVRPNSPFTDWLQMLPDTKTDRGLEAAWLIAIAYDRSPEDELALWQDALALVPENSIAAGNAARVLDDQKQFDKSIPLYEIAIKSSVPGNWRDSLIGRLGRARYLKNKADGGDG